jgi:pimeloyl-ACP methyl ester carboxylesterase
MRATARAAAASNTDAGQIEYAEAGSGFPLLSIHGAGGGFDQGLANAAELAGEGFRIVAPSRFGYLRTEVPEDSTPAAQADAHAALLLTIPRSVVVVSAGARSAVELAIRHLSSTTNLAPGIPLAVNSAAGNILNRSSRAVTISVGAVIFPNGNSCSSAVLSTLIPGKRNDKGSMLATMRMTRSRSARGKAATSKTSTGLVS